MDRTSYVTRKHDTAVIGSQVAAYPNGEEVEGGIGSGAPSDCFDSGCVESV